VPSPIDREAFVKRVGEMEARYGEEVAPVMSAIKESKAAIEAAGGHWPDAVLLPGPGALDAAARKELLAHMRVRGRQLSPASGNRLSSGCAVRLTITLRQGRQPITHTGAPCMHSHV
jgi:hypothetical protein